jgi:L-threonylcarbamoyladenylate synthase
MMNSLKLGLLPGKSVTRGSGAGYNGFIANKGNERDRMTKYWLAPSGYDPRNGAVIEAAEMIREGRQVAFPTETVYGLGADARNSEAVEGIFTAKGRPSDNPLIVHIADMGMLDELVEHVDGMSRKLAEAFWPGPLTLVLPVREGAVSSRVTAGLDTVAVRMPDHPVALSLIAAAGCPVAAPSANRSGRPSPTLAEHVRQDLDGRIAGILDGGATGVGLESTVAMVSPDGRLHVLRPGGVTPEELARVAGCPVELAGEHGKASEGRTAVVEPGAPEVVRDGHGSAVPAQEDSIDGSSPAFPVQEGSSATCSAVEGQECGERVFRPRAPGMKYTHYAPRGRLTIVKGHDPQAVAALIREELEQAGKRGERTAVLAPGEHLGFYGASADLVLPCGSLADPESVGRELFAALRRLDDEGMTCIYAEAFPEKGIGLAVMNRLLKAAGHRVLEA